MLLEIRDLTIFVAVAHTGSITKAADRLGYVQSNITARIHHLENRLGTSLFHRHPRGVSLTSSGEILLRYAERILNLCQEAEQAVQDTTTPSGPLRIGTMETTAATRLPVILAEYHQQFPKVELSLMTGPTAHLIDAVLNYEIDGAFVAGPIDHPLLENSAIIEEELVLISNREDMNATYDWSDLGHRTLVVFREGCSYRKQLEQWLDYNGIQSRTVIELGTVDGILGCVAAGLGISLVPRSLVAQGNYNLSVHELPDGYRKVPTVFLRHKNAFVSPALSQFIKVVQECFHCEYDLNRELV